MYVQVRNNNVEKALRVLKKKIKKAGLLQEIKERQYTKPQEKKRLAKNVVRLSKRKWLNLQDLKNNRHSYKMFMKSKYEGLWSKSPFP